MSATEYEVGWIFENTQWKGGATKTAVELDVSDSSVRSWDINS